MWGTASLTGSRAEPGRPGAGRGAARRAMQLPLSPSPPGVPSPRGWPWLDHWLGDGRHSTPLCGLGEKERERERGVIFVYVCQQK